MPANEGDVEDSEDPLEEATLSSINFDMDSLQIPNSVAEGSSLQSLVSHLFWSVRLHSPVHTAWPLE